MKAINKTHQATPFRRRLAVKPFRRWLTVTIHKGGNKTRSTTRGAHYNNNQDGEVLQEEHTTTTIRMEKYYKGSTLQQQSRWKSAEHTT